MGRRRTTCGNLNRGKFAIPPLFPMCLAKLTFETHQQMAMTARMLAHSPGQPEPDSTDFNLIRTQDIRDWNAQRKEGQPELEESMCADGLGDRQSPVKYTLWDGSRTLPDLHSKT